MADSTPYEMSEYYRPGFMSDVVLVAAGIGLVVVVFIVSVVGARYLLVHAKRLKPGTRKTLEFISGLAKPAEAWSARRRRRKEREQGRRRKTEPQYKLQVAAAGQTTSHGRAGSGRSGSGRARLRPQALRPGSFAEAARGLALLCGRRDRGGRRRAAVGQGQPVDRQQGLRIRAGLYPPARATAAPSPWPMDRSRSSSRCRPSASAPATK